MTKLKELERLLGQGQIGRREFLARATAVGALAAVSPAIMSGTAEAATPKQGGTVRFGIGHGSTTDSLDPGTFENAYIWGPAKRDAVAAWAAAKGHTGGGLLTATIAANLPRPPARLTKATRPSSTGGNTSGANRITS